MVFAALGDSRRAWELLAMINPVNHATSPEGIATYRVEPYVVAADVYALSPHTDRGGWTWYTGSAGCMYRLIVESLLGLRLEVDTLRVAPCLPADWTAFTVHYRYRETAYHIAVLQTPGGNGETSVRPIQRVTPNSSRLRKARNHSAPNLMWTPAAPSPTHRPVVSSLSSDYARGPS